LDWDFLPRGGGSPAEKAGKKKRLIVGKGKDIEIAPAEELLDDHRGGERSRPPNPPEKTPPGGERGEGGKGSFHLTDSSPETEEWRGREWLGGGGGRRGGELEGKKIGSIESLSVCP